MASQYICVCVTLYMCESLLLFVSSVTSSSQGFKPDAGSQVTAGYKYVSDPRRSDISELLVEWDPTAMISPPEVPKVPMEQWLEVQSGDSRGEGWVRMGDPSHRRSRYRWTVPVLPCLQHRVRLSVVTKSGNTLTYTVPNPVARATQDQLENSRHKFVPESVKSLNAEVTTESSVRLSWLQSPCATNYEIYVARRNVETDEKSENTSDTRLVVSGLEACTDYDVSVYANLATESSDEATADFTTPPLLNAADDIVASVKDEVSEGSVFISWSSPASLQCVLTYTASVCDQAGVCKQKEEVPNMGTGEQIHYTATNMETCSNYTVRIQPQFGDRQLQPKLIQYSTWNQECVPEINIETHTEEVKQVNKENSVTTEDPLPNDQSTHHESKSSMVHLPTILTVLALTIFLTVTR